MRAIYLFLFIWLIPSFVEGEPEEEITSFADLRAIKEKQMAKITSAQGRVSFWSKAGLSRGERDRSKRTYGHGNWLYYNDEWRLDFKGSLPAWKVQADGTHTPYRDKSLQQYQYRGDLELRHRPEAGNATIARSLQARLCDFRQYGLLPLTSELNRACELEENGQVVEFRIEELNDKRGTFIIHYMILMEVNGKPTSKCEMHVVRSMDYSIIYMVGKGIGITNKSSGRVYDIKQDRKTGIWYPAKARHFWAHPRDWDKEREYTREYSFYDVEFNVALTRDDLDIVMPPETLVQSSAQRRVYTLKEPATMTDILAGQVEPHSISPDAVRADLANRLAPIRLSRSKF
jgi:hypothetical protein